MALINRKAVINAHIAGIFFGYSMFARFGFIAVVFYIGAVLMNEGDGYDTKGVF